MSREHSKSRVFAATRIEEADDDTKTIDGFSMAELQAMIFDGVAFARSRKATCACRHIIRVSRKTMLNTVIRCESCGEPFSIV